MPGHITRRRFVQRVSAGSCLITGLNTTLESAFTAQTAGKPATYDLLIAGGRAIDPSQNLSDPRDIAISGSVIARVEPRIPESAARHVLNARGRIVTPGLIDLHVHVYDGVAPLGIPADPNCIAKGATTVVDAVNCWTCVTRTRSLRSAP